MKQMNHKLENDLLNQKQTEKKKKRKIFTWHWHFHDIIRGKLELEWLRDIPNKNNLILNNIFNIVTEKNTLFCPRELVHYYLEVQANPKRNGTKKPMLFLASMGKTGLSHDIFFWILTCCCCCWGRMTSDFVIISESLAPNLEKVR